jgi:hypothetical protein
VLEAAYGNSAEARQSAADALKLAPASQGVDVETALALVRMGGMLRNVTGEGEVKCFLDRARRLLVLA